MEQIRQFKFSAMLLFSLALTFTACRRNSPDPQVLIIGKWGTVKIVNDSYENQVKVNTTTSTTFTNDDYMEFKSNGTAVFSSPGFVQNGTYSIDAAGTKLSVAYQGSTAVQTIDIRSLSSSDLVIHQQLPSVLMQNKTYQTVLEGTYRKR